MITGHSQGDYGWEYYITIPSEQAWKNMNEIFAWAKEQNISPINRGDMDWIHHTGLFVAGVPTEDLAMEFLLRFG